MSLYPQQQPLIDRFLAEQSTTIVDIGAGLGEHTDHFLRAGRHVIAVDHSITPALMEVHRTYASRCRIVQCDVSRLPFAANSVESIWASHCLEHMRDPFGVLGEWRRVLLPTGRLAIAVPPYKSEIVGRHMFTGWNPGQLMLTLLIAGFDVHDGVFARHKYNIFGLVRKSAHPICPAPNEDILMKYHDRFPTSIRTEILRNRTANTFGEIISSFDGDFERLGWDKPDGSDTRRKPVYLSTRVPRPFQTQLHQSRNATPRQPPSANPR